MPRPSWEERTFQGMGDGIIAVLQSSIRAAESSSSDRNATRWGGKGRMIEGRMILNPEMNA
jgi:hypothetical protein